MVNKDTATSPPPTPEHLMRSLGAEDTKSDRSAKLPPVHLWNPPFCGDLQMKIRRDGTWFYMGTPIARKPMVKLFSSILRFDDDGKYYLVTPVEKVGITVEDAPFVAVELEAEGTGRGQTLSFRTQVDDWVTADREHPIRVEIDRESDEPSPYVRVRARLDALISRPVFYELVALGVEEQVDGTQMFGVWSCGAFFPFAPAGDVFGT